MTDLYFGGTTTHDTEDALLLEAIRTTVCPTWRRSTCVIDVFIYSFVHNHIFARVSFVCVFFWYARTSLKLTMSFSFFFFFLRYT